MVDLRNSVSRALGVGHLPNLMHMNDFGVFRDLNEFEYDLLKAYIPRKRNDGNVFEGDEQRLKSIEAAIISRLIDIYEFRSRLDYPAEAYAELAHARVCDAVDYLENVCRERVSRSGVLRKARSRGYKIDFSSDT